MTTLKTELTDVTAEYCDTLSGWEVGDTIEFRIRHQSPAAVRDVLNHVTSGGLQLKEAELDKLTLIAARGRWTQQPDRTFRATLTEYFTPTFFVMMVCSQIEWLKLYRRRPQLDINSVLGKDGAVVHFRFKSNSAAAQRMLYQLHQVGAVVVKDDQTAELLQRLEPGFNCTELPTTTARYNGSMTSNLHGNPVAMKLFMENVVRHLELLRS